MQEMTMRAMTAAAAIALIAVPFATHAARPAPADTASPAAAAQSQPGTALPGITVIAPAPGQNDPWRPSTWRFHSGASRYQPRGGVGTGGYGGSGDGVVIARSP